MWTTKPCILCGELTFSNLWARSGTSPIPEIFSRNISYYSYTKCLASLNFAVLLKSHAFLGTNFTQDFLTRPQDFKSYCYAYFWQFSLCTWLEEARDNHATNWMIDCLNIPSVRLVIPLLLYSVCHKVSEDGGNVNWFFAICKIHYVARLVPNTVSLPSQTLFTHAAFTVFIPGISIFWCVFLLVKPITLCIQHFRTSYVISPNVSEFIPYTTYKGFRYRLSGSHSNDPCYFLWFLFSV